MVDLQRAFEWQQAGFSQTVLVFKAYQPFKSRVHLFELQVVTPTLPHPTPSAACGWRRKPRAIVQPVVAAIVISQSKNRCDSAVAVWRDMPRAVCE